MEDDEETSEVPDALCFPQSSTKIYCLFFSETHSCIDGTKDWKTMKKRLRFLLPRTPLKDLRGEQDEEDLQDKYYNRFQAPGTTTEDAEDDRDIDDESRRSSLSHEGIPTDIGEASEEGGARYLGSSLDTENNPPNAPENPPNVPEYPPNGPENPPIAPNVQEYDTTGSINLEAEDVQVVAHVHHLPDSDEVSYDDTAPLLNNN